MQTNEIQIFMGLMKHIDYLECLKKNTQHILNCEGVQNIDELSSLTDNRNRLLGLIKDYQHKVLEELKELSKGPKLSEEIKDILKTWGADTNNLIEEVRILEKSATENLVRKKDELKKDILDLQNEKKLLQKYGLSSVR